MWTLITSDFLFWAFAIWAVGSLVALGRRRVLAVAEKEADLRRRLQDALDKLDELNRRNNHRE